MTNGLKYDKSVIREKMLEKRLAVPADKLSSAQDEMIKRFLMLASFRYADVILLYSAIKGEPDLSGIIAEASRLGKRIAFPKCYPDEYRMEYRFIEDPSQLLPGKYGIPEPSGTSEIYIPSVLKHDICIVPAVCFDRDGFRIGYGKGYYDRFLSCFGGTTVGFVMSDFLIDKVPRGRFDKKVDLIITERGVVSPL